MGPVEVGVGGLAADEAEGVEGVVGGPFALEGAEGAVPDEAVGVLGANGHQLTLEVLLADFERRFELDVIRGYLVIHTDTMRFNCSLVHGAVH